MGKHICLGCMNVIEDHICPYCGWSSAKNNQPHQLRAGTLLRGQFLVGKVLGQGGFGITYIGRDVKQNKVVAIKEYYPSFAVTRNSNQSPAIQLLRPDVQDAFQSGRNRFLQEGALYARFQNVPEIVTIHSLFTDNNTSYIVLEYVSGVDLRKHTKIKGGKLTAEETLQYIRPIIRALDAVHKSGLVHRDVTPDNIMILSDGSVKLLDFGAAHDICDPNPNAELTHSTTAILKQGFAPPEQYRARGNLGPWTDEYGICATIYYCIHGELPPDAMARVLNNIEPDWNVPGLSAHQRRVLQKGMSLQPAERYGALDLFEAELYRVEPVTATNTDLGQTVARYEDSSTDNGHGTVVTDPIHPNPLLKYVPIVAACLALLLLLSPVVRNLRKEPDPNTPPTGIQTEKPQHVNQTEADAYPDAEAYCAGQWASGQYDTVLDHLRAQVDEHPNDPRYANLLAHYEGELSAIYIADARELADAGQYTASILTLDQAYRDYGFPELGKAAGDMRMEFGISNTSYIAAGKYNSLMIWDNASVTAVGDDEYKELEADHWVGISAVSAGDRHVVGLRTNGTVVSEGANDQLQRNVGSWANVVAISAGDVHTVGLLADGTVVAAGPAGTPRCDAAGLHALAGEKRIVSIAAGYLHTLALLEDGTVVAVGENGNYQCNVDTWTDIAAIYAGTDYSIGLKTDGTIVLAGLTYPDYSSWSNIVNIGAGDFFFVGVTGDGRLLSAGVENEIGPNTARVISLWDDIVMASVGNDHIAALTRSGKTLCAGKNDLEQLNIEGVYLTYPRPVRMPVK